MRTYLINVFPRKDHVGHEVVGAKNWPSNWEFLTQDYEEVSGWDFDMLYQFEPYWIFVELTEGTLVCL